MTPASDRLDSRALVASHRSFDPWSSEHLVLVLVINAVGAAVIVAGGYQAGGALALRTQLSWLEVGVVGLLIAVIANALWLLRGRQAVTLARVAVLSARQRAELFAVPSIGQDRLVSSVSSDVAAQTSPPALIWVVGTTRFHRPNCMLVTGKPVRRLGPSDRAGLSACEVCEAGEL